VIKNIRKGEFIMGNYVQWSTGDGQTFFPAGKVVKELPPGYYSIESSMQGLYFKQKKPKSESLLRFPDAGSDMVIEEIENFWGLEDNFRDEGLPYKRGIIMYGPPGSGKTCTLRIVVENLIKEHEGIVFDFPGASMFKEGYPVLRQIHPDLPVVVLMEDVDAILGGYDESETLNLLDGMHDIDKVVFLATTNYPEKLGARIMNRPSRFDKKVFVGMPNEDSRKIYLESRLNDKDEIDKWVGDTEGFSIAHLKELYVANKLLGDSYPQALSTLKDMRVTPGSRSFDDYEIVEEEGYTKLPMIKEKYWSKYGRKGEMYMESKKTSGGLLTESVSRKPNGRRLRDVEKPKTEWASDPDSIAGMLGDI
jgi:hypothetical protein